MTHAHRTESPCLELAAAVLDGNVGAHSPLCQSIRLLAPDGALDLTQI